MGSPEIEIEPGKVVVGLVSFSSDSDSVRRRDATGVVQS